MVGTPSLSSCQRRLVSEFSRSGTYQLVTSRLTNVATSARFVFFVMVWSGVVWCGVVWCGVVWCGVVWCGVVWCGVVWCGVVWCGVVWCGVVR